MFYNTLGTIVLVWTSTQNAQCMTAQFTRTKCSFSSAQPYWNVHHNIRWLDALIKFIQPNQTKPNKSIDNGRMSEMGRQLFDIFSVLEQTIVFCCFCWHLYVYCMIHELLAAIENEFAFCHANLHCIVYTKHIIDIGNDRKNG